MVGVPKPLRPIYPLLAFTSSLIIFFAGLLLVKSPNIYLYLGLITLLFLAFGYGKTWLVVSIPGVFFALVTSLVILTYSPFQRALENGLRTYILFFSATLSLAVNPLDLMRTLNRFNFPRSISIGILIAFRFLPVIIEDGKRIRVAMRTRGGGKGGLVARARSFLFPLIMRIFTLSDGLTVSLQTRAFTMEGEASCYKEVKWGRRDSLFLACLVLIFGGLYAI